MGKGWLSEHRRIAQLVCDTLVFSRGVEHERILTCLPQRILLFILPAIRPTHGASRA
jgi:hypothetical protein